MTYKKIWKLCWALTVLYGMSTTVTAETIDDPCSGPTALLNIIDRPSNADSACVVPFKKTVVELGYQYQQLTHSAGQVQNFPEAVLRVGIPYNSELVIQLPNYLHQSMTPHSGYSAAVIGIKHEIGYTKSWVTAVEGLYTLPNGSAAFGNQGPGFAFNGIASYTINPAFNLTFMLGGSTDTLPSAYGGQRYNSINPDIILTYSLNPKADIYAEVYGHSKTAPGQRSGFNSDAGIIYLFRPYMTLDLELGQRISGNLAGLSHYIGTGMAIEF